MDRSRWQMVGISVTASLTLIWSLNWFVKQLIPDINPGELAYKPVEDLPPLVDLVKVPAEPVDMSCPLRYQVFSVIDQESELPGFVVEMGCWQVRFA